MMPLHAATDLGSPIGHGSADWDLEAFWGGLNPSFLRGLPVEQFHLARLAAERASVVSSTKRQEFSKGTLHTPEAIGSWAHSLTKQATAERPLQERENAWTTEYPAQAKAAPSANYGAGVFFPGVLLLQQGTTVRGPALSCDVALDEEAFWDVRSRFSDDLFLDACDGFLEPQASWELSAEPVKSPLAVSLSSGFSSDAEDEPDRWMTGSLSHTTGDSTAGSVGSSSADLSEFSVRDVGRDPRAKPAAGSGTSSLWGLRRLMSSGLDPSSAHTPEGERDELPPAQLADREAQGTPPCRGGDDVACAGATLSSGLAEEGRGALDIIPDSDLLKLLQDLEDLEEDVRMLAPPQAVSSKMSAGKPQSSGPASSSTEALEGTTSWRSDQAPGKAKWRLIMEKNTEWMQYTTWARDKGSHFGAMEFRGRMLLMQRAPQGAGQGKAKPQHQGVSGVQGSKAACVTPMEGGREAGGLSRAAAVGTAQQPWWGPEAVRDFLLDEVHRADWDSGREASGMLEEWDEAGCSAARWVRKLPLFLRSREYVVARRVWSPADQPRTYYCISRSSEHPAAPPSSQFVRVSSFFSSWRVRALSVEETQEQWRILSQRSRGRGHSVKGHKAPSACTCSDPRHGDNTGMCATNDRAVEIITHYEEDSGLPKDLIRVGVAHSMWGHMLKMEEQLRVYCASGRNLRHVLPVFILQAEQQAVAAESAAAMTIRRGDAATDMDQGMIGHDHRPSRSSSYYPNP